MSKAYKNFTDATKAVKTNTPQSQAIPGREKEMVKNAAGGHSFKMDEFGQLDRFLILGSEGGTYYATEQKLTANNAKNIIKAIGKDGVRVVNRIVEISDVGRAPKNDPALFALALVFAHGDNAAKAAAAEALPHVARIGTHIFHLAEYIKGLRSWGRPVKRGFSNWYNGKTSLKLAEQMVKYANRDGWTHRDVLRLAHVKPISPTHDALFTDAVGKAKNVEIDTDVAEYMAAVDELKKATTAKQAVKLIEAHKFPRELVPTELLNETAVWEALLPHMGMEAMIRNLATMTRVSLIAPLSSGTQAILAKMANVDAVKKSRLHPIKVLTAFLTYKAGHGQRGSNTWTANSKILDGLDALFYNTFQNVEPTGKSTVVGLDISGSMWGGDVAGVLGLTPALAAAAMALITAKTEQNYVFLAFTTNTRIIDFGNRDSLDSVEKKMEILSRYMGGTDCAEPMNWASRNKVEADAFYVYTDNETWAGTGHPSQALKQYRTKLNRPAKLVTVAFTATNASIADPQDAGMMDVVGFDSAAPTVIADFMRGEF